MRSPKVTRVKMTLTVTVKDSEDCKLPEKEAWNVAAQWITVLQYINGWEFASLQWTSYNTVELEFTP